MTSLTFQTIQPTTRVRRGSETFTFVERETHKDGRGYIGQTILLVNDDKTGHLVRLWDDSPQLSKFHALTRASKSA